MNEAPSVPTPSNTDPSTWQESMVRLAARYNDSQFCLDKLNNILAEGQKCTPNELRRAEEDCVRSYSLFLTALIESYS